MRTRTSPKSPTKRALTDLSDGGNSSPMPLRKRSSTEADRENMMQFDSVGDDKENTTSSQEDNSELKSTRAEKRRSGGFMMNDVIPMSPMKRSEGSMMTGQSGFESPSAKRRSVHAPSMDFSIFDSESLQDGSFTEPRAQDDNDWFRQASPLLATRFLTIPRRSSSLRKSTLQQRQMDRPSIFKLPHMAELDGAWFASTPAANEKKGLRMSLDNHLPAMQRESPFSSQASLLNASVHPVVPAQKPQPQTYRHPLSRTMTQSSSTPSAPDDSPTHEPIHRPDRPKSHDFSKSLPIGALRPANNTADTDSNEYSSQASFATPANYKTAKPLPAAFMSTGLISKKNRNVEAPDAGLPKAHMPDTPCKRQSIIFADNTKHVPVKPLLAKNPKHIFGTPSTPAEGHQFTKPSPFHFAKSISIFGSRSTKNSLMRKASFASIESDDKAVSQSPTGKGDSQSTDSDYPPTPTKHTMSESARNISVSPSPHNITSFSTTPFGTGSIQAPRFSSKLLPIQASPASVDGDSDSVMEDSPSANLRPKSSLKAFCGSSSSFTQTRVLKNLNSPTPLSRNSIAIPALHSPALERTKLALLPVSPRVDRFDRTSPHTPQESIFPPDPSGLSISGKWERPGSGQGSSVPATPTGPKEYFPNFSNRPSLNLASADIADVDSSLTSRFEKVDLTGAGEFSQVYRVSQPPETSPFHKIYSMAVSRSDSRSSLPERVFAVKKSRYPYAGAKDRQRKIHEVDVLKALGHSDHILSFVDSWEDNSHLYIQTEFCEEGTLDVFLAQVGVKARLDDFRIWKILLELSLGLKHIHDSGFIHLDLKPANVLITFEGVMKIGDFGMAARWPAKAGIEGEGDREYIGPEILMGKYDKPADIFALGLILLETAGNVELPDNGVSWQKLRNGDMSDVPSLTWSSEASNIFRDSTGNPVSDEPSFNEDDNMDMQDVEVVHSNNPDQGHSRQGKAIHLARSGELTQPPAFMVDANNEQALDRIVRWMISPNPTDRPLAGELLQTEGVSFAQVRRRAGATVFEGNWGPADEVLAEDAEMIDV